jgi:hypothetical protein
MKRLRNIIAGRETPPIKDTVNSDGNDLEASGLVIA